MMGQRLRTLAEPSELPQQAFTALAQAVTDVADPWRTPVLATVHDGYPDARTVVVRSVDARQRTLWCFSDLLTAKVDAIRRNPQVAWCFYDPNTRTQLRLKGHAVVEAGGEQTEKFWRALSPTQQRNYGPEPRPGTAVTTPFEIRWRESPFDHFTVIATEVIAMDWLELHPDVHRRASAGWDGRSWASHWVAP